MKTLCMFLAIVMLIGCLTGCAPSETAQTENVTTGTVETTSPIYEPSHTEVPFAVQYIRTDGYTEGANYPEVAFVLRPEELQSYYTANKDRFDLEHRENYGSDYTMGFLDACEKYDEAYFKENYLILVALEEPSGSVHHELEQVIVDFGGQDTELWIKRIVPEAGTDDMAQWHLIVELQKHGVTEYSGAVQVYIDGELAYDTDRAQSQSSENVPAPQYGLILPFETQFIRTGGYAEDAKYPKATVIHSLQELQDYYTRQKDRFDLERRETYGSDYTMGFLDACDKYEEPYFTDHFLVLVTLEEPSGSIRHEIELVMVGVDDGDMTISINRLVPEVGTDDMAQWHVFLELPRYHDITGNYPIDKIAKEIEVYIDVELAYDVDRIVPPEEAPSFTEPPAGTVVTPWQESSMMPGGYHWFYKLSDGTESGTIADQGSRPVSRDCVQPILIGKDQAETVYLPVPGSHVYEPTNSLGYPVKISWEIPPKSVQCTAWPEAVWEQEGIGETHVSWNPGDIFYAKEGGWLYEFFASWEGEDYRGTANYYVYIVGGADHTHQPATEPQTVDDPVTGYCGNTWTTLHLQNGQEYSFMYGYSVTLTDILANLNYDPMKVCRCLPQYTVDTEFGTGYGINLSQGYARCEKGQAKLTQEQINTIREIIDWAITTNCTYPIEN